MRPARRASVQQMRYEILTSFGYSPCVIASTLLHKRAPGRLAYAAALKGQDLPSATVGRYCGQHATAVHLCGVKNVLTVRREARRFVMCRVRQARGASALQVLDIKLERTADAGDISQLLAVRAHARAGVVVARERNALRGACAFALGRHFVDLRCAATVAGEIDRL